MIIPIWIVGYFLIGQSIYSTAQVPTTTFRYPAESELTQAIWFGWAKKDSTIHKTVATIIVGLSGKVAIKIAVATPELMEQAKESLGRNGVDLTQVTFHIIPGDRFWIRDNGATFLTNGMQLAVADFEWSSYGYYDWLIKKRPDLAYPIAVLKSALMMNDDSNLDQEMASLTQAPIIKSSLVMEGGALETNGLGVLLQCEQVTLQRNPGWTKKEIEAELRRVLSIKKVIWLKKGTADDTRSFIPDQQYAFTGTGGHLDEFVRFADPHTILLAWIDEMEIDKHPLNRMTYKRMKENFEILRKATDQDGRPFRIIKVPLPSVVELPQGDKGSVEGIEVNLFPLEPPQAVDVKRVKIATVSYLNFLITNEMIVNASYVNHGTSVEHEERVKAIFAEVFPGRQQLWVDALPLNRRGGGIHCITLPEPVSGSIMP